MKKFGLILALTLLTLPPLIAQVSNPSIIVVSSAPSGSCGGSGLPMQYVFSTGVLYACQNGTWGQIGGGGGGGPYLRTDGGTMTGAAVLFTGSTAPTQAAGDASTDIANDQFVSNAIAGVNPAVAVLAASTANLTGTYAQVGGGVGDTFTVTATGAFTLDGIAINTIGQRVLFKDQSTASQNGVYTATIVGTTGVSPVFTRATDYDTPSDVNNTGAIPVQSGTANTTTSWLLTSQVTSIGSAGSALTYALFSYAPTSIALVANTPQLLCKYTVAVNNTGDTTNDVSHACTIPAGTLGANSVVKVTEYNSQGANTGSCTYRLNFNTAANGTGTNVLIANGPAVTASRTAFLTGQFWMNNSTAAESANGFWIVPTNVTTLGGINTGTVNTATTTIYVTFTTQNSNSADTCTISYGDVTLQQ